MLRFAYRYIFPMYCFTFFSFSLGNFDVVDRLFLFFAAEPFDDRRGSDHGALELCGGHGLCLLPPHPHPVPYVVRLPRLDCRRVYARDPTARQALHKISHPKVI